MSTPTSGESSSGTDERAEPQRIRAIDVEPAPSPRIVPSVVLAVVAAAAVVVAPMLGIVASVDGSPVGSGAAAARVVAAVLPIVVAVIAVVTSKARRVEAAGAILAGYGAVTLGVVLLDVALLIDPIDANRLELFRPVSAALLEPTLGAYFLLAGHAASVLAGFGGWLAVHRAALGDGYGHSVYSEHVGRATAGRVGPALAVPIGVFGVLAAGAGFSALYSSSDPVVLVTAVVESPIFVAIGSGLVGLAALVVTAAASASLSPAVASGSLIGAGLGVLSFGGVGLAAGLTTGGRVEAGLGAYVGTVAGLGLVIVGALVGPVAARRDSRALRSALDQETNRRSSNTGGGTGRWHVATGVVGTVSGIGFVLGSLLPILETEGNRPDILATRVVLVAGFVLILAAVPLMFSEIAAATRPFVSIFWLAAVLAAAEVLQSVVLAEDIDGVGTGVGALIVIAAVVGAVVTGLLALFAGSAERDDVDTSDDAETSGTVLGIGLVGAVLLAVGLALPLYRGRDLTASSVTEFPWGWDAWGQVLFAIGAVVAAIVAARARPARGSVLLAGTAVGGLLYLASWPLTSARAIDPEMGPGVVPAVLGVLVLAVAAVLSARRTGR